MRNSIGNNLVLTLFGESHGEYIGATLDGFTPGIKVDEEFLKECLDKRRPSSNNETSRIEKDDYQIISGVFNSYTTGQPITILISNNNVRSSDYDKTKDLARPSHIDYVAENKYHSFQDYRGGGHFSGRITAPIVGLGSIPLKALEKFNIKIGTHIKQCGKVEDRDFSIFSKDVEREIDYLNKLSFPVLDDVQLKMEKEIEIARKDLDSVGGIIQVAITNLPVGLGEPWFSSLESEISKAVFGIGGVKGIEFGEGFKMASKRGSETIDSFYNEDGKVVTSTNRNGGINGGISNGMPVIFNLAIRPTASIAKKLDTINIKTKQNTSIELTGRHDPAIIRRINIVIRTLVAIVIADLLEVKYGSDVFLKERLD